MMRPTFIRSLQDVLAMIADIDDDEVAWTFYHELYEVITGEGDTSQEYNRLITKLEELTGR